MTKERIALFLVAALLGAGIGLVDHAQTEVLPAVVMLLGCGFALGFAQPRDAWLSGLVVGSGVPIVDLASRALGQAPLVPSVAGSSVHALVSTNAAIQLLGGPPSGAGSRQMYQSRFGSSRDERDATNHG
jgi:hypothetical protein